MDFPLPTCCSIRKAVAGLLAFVVLGCPYVCSLSGAVAASESGKPKAACCSRCPPVESPAGEHGTPARPAPKDQGNCLCGGCLIESVAAGSESVSHTKQPALDTLVAPCLAAVQGPALAARASCMTAGPPCPSSGRMLRAIISSWLI